MTKCTHQIFIPRGVAMAAEIAFPLWRFPTQVKMSSMRRRVKFQSDKNPRQPDRYGVRACDVVSRLIVGLAHGQALRGEG
ncbi:hypothetical protein SDJN03_22267, partial [Cucurbita argyrosperma subsp. sororia]